MTAAKYQIVGGDYERGGSASRSVKDLLKKVGADPAVVRRAMVAAYEAEMNVVIHAHRGELRARLENGQLDVEVSDEGPGIADLAQAMRPGYSTACPKARELGFGAGMGLPNIKKSSDQFSVESTVGQGTCVRFSIRLKPQTLYGTGRHSLHVQAERCRQSLRCVRACPTQAIRVFRGRPEVLDYLCIDCTACIAVCPSGTLSTGGTSESLAPSAETALVVSPESLAQFGAGVSPQRVLEELAGLGWTDVRLSSAWEDGLRAAVLEHLGTAARVWPVISPACPAAVNLIETRFPSLIPNVAPFLSAVEALRAELGGRRLAVVASCPCQRTALLSGADPQPAVILPAALRAAIAPRVAHARAIGPASEGSASEPAAVRAKPELLRVTGLRHVLSVLEAIEDGLAADIRVVEPWVCDQGCFGSPLLAENPFLARRRWEAAQPAPRPAAQAVRRAQPLVPRRGLRLDEDMSKAIAKLGKIDRLRRTLPGSDCGMCGAPTCAALAEDVVLGRTQSDACVRRRDDAGDQEKAR